MLFKITILVLVSHASCGTIRQGRSSCPVMFCPQYFHAICGSDGKTYDNECYLKAAQCKDSTLQLSHDGSCTSPTHIVCTTPVCMPTYEPVCGSDGITYGNGCHFSNAHCENPDLKLAHTGPCATLLK